MGRVGVGRHGSRLYALWLQYEAEHVLSNIVCMQIVIYIKLYT